MASPAWRPEDHRITQRGPIASHPSRCSHQDRKSRQGTDILQQGDSRIVVLAQCHRRDRAPGAGDGEQSPNLIHTFNLAEDFGHEAGRVLSGWQFQVFSRQQLSLHVEQGEFNACRRAGGGHGGVDERHTRIRIACSVHKQ